MKWMHGAKEGIVVAGGQGNGNGLAQLSSPRGVYVDQSETIYVADYNNNRVVRWFKGTAQGSIVVDGNGDEKKANQLAYPMGLKIDQQGSLYIVDYLNYRIQKFNIDPKSTS
jgi:sugar lactone lactonase YvrE